MPEIRLRHARDEDVFAFWRWWGDRETQRFNRTPTMTLSWEQHIAWFAENITSPHWYVAEVEETMEVSGGIITRTTDHRSVGVLRYDLGDIAWWVSIVLAPEHRGKGYGTAMLGTPISGLATVTIFARIHRFNVPSIRAFEKAGYVLDRKEEIWLIYRRRP